MYLTECTEEKNSIKLLTFYVLIKLLMYTCTSYYGLSILKQIVKKHEKIMLLISYSQDLLFT